MLKCEKCGKELKNDLALKIHIGRMHAEAKAKPAPKKGGRPSKAAKGSIVCSICGRQFKLPAHLARHTGAAHGKARKVRKVRRAAGRKVVLRAAPIGPEVGSLTIDQLIGLKQQVDARLADIVRQMRAARVRV